MKVKMINTGREVLEAEEKVNKAILELVKTGARVMGIVDTGLRVMITYAPMQTAPEENPTMSDGKKRFVTPEEMKEIESLRKTRESVEKGLKQAKEGKLTKNAINLDDDKKPLTKKSKSAKIKPKKKEK